MDTETPQPQPDDRSKSIRVTARVHARLSRIVEETGCANIGDAVSLLLDPTVVRVVVSREQRMRWEAEAQRAGMTLPHFVMARVEAAMEFGADPGSLRHIRSMVFALTQAAGLEPTPPSTRHRPPMPSTS